MRAFCVAVIVLVSVPYLALAKLWDGMNSSILVPSSRSGSAGVDIGGGVIIHGGCTSSCCYAPLDDTWLLLNGQWSCLGPGASGRLNHVAVPGAETGTAFIFGGSTGISGFLNDLWHIDVTSGLAKWTLLSGNSEAPIPLRGGHAAVALPPSMVPAGSDAFVIYGGVNADSVLGDVWVYVGGSWAQAAQSSPAPGPRTQHTLVLYSGGAPGNGERAAQRVYAR